jgi:hypothetical protein
MNYVWTGWLALIVLTFAGLETYALMSNKPTLSRFVWTLSTAWPPFPWIAGFITGFLVCHFWWGGIVSFAPVVKSVGGWFNG